MRYRVEMLSEDGQSAGQRLAEADSEFEAMKLVEAQLQGAYDDALAESQDEAAYAVSVEAALAEGDPPPPHPQPPAPPMKVISATPIEE